jgi:electron transfer flavoprotein alpha/beta subunit
MNILVCIKQVPDTTEVKVDPKTGRLIREGVPSIMNPEDKNAVEAAIQLKEKHKAEVTVLTMGPPQAETVLREALAMGADNAYLLCDFKFAGSDTWATANALGAAVKHIGKFDIILCGRQAIDGDTAQVGPQLAENLDIPQITYVEKLEINNNKVTAHRALEDGYEVVEVDLPVLLTATKELNEPRYVTLNGIKNAYRNKEIKTLTAADIKIKDEEVGLKASPTNVKKSFAAPQKSAAGIKIEGSPKDAAKKLIELLMEKEIIQEF